MTDIIDDADIVLDIAMRAARRREDLDGTPWRESLAETWLAARDLRTPRADYAQERQVDALCRIPLDSQDDEVDALVAEELHPPVDPDANIRRAEIHGALARELLRLSPRMERMLRLRFGLADDVEWTQEAIADTMNVTKGRIHSLEQEAMRRLRAPAVRHRVMPFAPKGIRAAMSETLARELKRDMDQRRARQQAEPPQQPQLSPPPPEFWRMGPVARAKIAARYGYDLSQA